MFICSSDLFKVLSSIIPSSFFFNLFLSTFFRHLPLLIRLFPFQCMHSLLEIILALLNLHPLLLLGLRLLLGRTLIRDILIQLAARDDLDLHQRLRQLVQCVQYYLSEPLIVGEQRVAHRDHDEDNCQGRD
jgi:hypothetical protein